MFYTTAQFKPVLTEIVANSTDEHIQKIVRQNGLDIDAESMCEELAKYNLNLPTTGSSGKVVSLYVLLKLMLNAGCDTTENRNKIAVALGFDNFVDMRGVHERFVQSVRDVLPDYRKPIMPYDTLILGNPEPPADALDATMDSKLFHAIQEFGRLTGGIYDYRLDVAYSKELQDYCLSFCDAIE